MWLTKREPCEPPNTNNVDLSGAKPSLVRASSLLVCVSFWQNRMGYGARIHLCLGNKCVVCSKQTKVVCASGASALIALPGFTLSSYNAIGMRNIRAAMHTGTAIIPPELIIFLGLTRYK